MYILIPNSMAPATFIKICIKKKGRRGVRVYSCKNAGNASWNDARESGRKNLRGCI